MILILGVILLLAPALNGQEIYDLLLKNGQVIDSANNRNGRFDVAVIGNKIARVARDLPAAHARMAIDASQYYVTPGLIDINARFSVSDPGRGTRSDPRCLSNGVTTAVDSGSVSSRDFEAWKASVIDDRSKVRVLALLNMSGQDPDATARVARRYPQLIPGVFAESDVNLAVKTAELFQGIVMTTQPGPLRKGDIVSHVYGKTLQPWMEAAQARGILFDAGHGSHGFSFSVAVPAISRGFLPDTVSSGIENSTDVLPLAGMMDTMSKLLNLGVSLEQIVERATVNPALAIRHPDLGTLSEGAVADIALLEVQRGDFGFLDSVHAKLKGDRRLRCVLTVRNGAILWDSEGLTATDSIHAGPYSNFK
ncbi:MAG: amidohydrolase family protein [Acidobacteriota bacterium]|nr:amidohydrolase family protein [Acidobacteriota bacterium]